MDYWQFVNFHSLNFAYAKYPLITVFSQGRRSVHYRSLQPCQNPPNSQKRFSPLSILPLKKESLRTLFLMAGTTRLVSCSLAIDSTPRFAFCGKCATGKTVPALARLRNSHNCNFSLYHSKLNSGRKTHRYLIRERRGSNSRPHA